MKNAGRERNILIPAIIIVLAAAVSAFLINNNLKEIINSIHDEVSTDYSLIVIKDISLDLLEIENSVQLFTLTKKRSHLEDYEQVSSRLKRRIGLLAKLSRDNEQKAQVNDSVRSLVEARLEIWDEIRQINVFKNNPQQQFDELYSMLERKEIDTVKVEVKVEPPKKKGLLRKIFGKKDTAVTRIDTSYVERTVENEEIREEIEALESDLKRQEQRKNRRELKLIEENIVVTGKLNKLIAQIEEAERDSLIAKNDEADRLATIIYNRLSAFSVAAVILMFVVLYLFVRYLQKARKVQKTLIEAKHSAENLAKAKEVFMANVSHEMRTPVNAIYSLAEQLLREKTNKKVQEKHNILLKSSKHLKEVVNDTLDFSKIQANKLKIQRIDFSPDNVISEVLNILKPEAEIKGVDLRFRRVNDLPGALLGDPFRLKQILLNTVGNAIKFTEKGSVTLIAEWKNDTNGQLQLLFQVVDTGIGIPEENLELIFEDFVQIETDYTRKFGGTGLGLSIVKKLIELQGGDISISSKLNSGTNVTFCIPYRFGNPAAIKEPELQKLVIPEKVKNLAILVVDDDEYNRYVLKMIFEKWGLKNHREAANGKEAVQLVAQNEFDLIFMDLRMPEINGIEASKLIKKEKTQMPIVALTTISNNREAEMFREAGMEYFLSKPFAEAELLDIIQSVLETGTEIKTEPAGFNLKELEHLVNGDRDFMKEMIGIFIRSATEGIAGIKLALELEDWRTISEMAHKMSASCKHINAIDLYDDLKLLEEYTQNKEVPSNVSDLVLAIEKKIISINNSLEVFIESGKPED